MYNLTPKIFLFGIFILALPTAILAMVQEEDDEVVASSLPHKQDVREKAPSIADLYLRKRMESDDIQDTSQALEEFSVKCQGQLVQYSLQECRVDDPNCGLEEELAHFFLQVCRRLTQGVKDTKEQVQVIKALSQLSRSQMGAEFLTTCYCLIPGGAIISDRIDLIGLIGNHPSEEYNMLMRCHAGLASNTMDAMVEVQLIRIIFSVPAQNQDVFLNYCQKRIKERDTLDDHDRLGLIGGLAVLEPNEYDGFMKSYKPPPKELKEEDKRKPSSKGLSSLLKRLF